MEECVYCNARATTIDAVGLPTCSKHSHEADEYYKRRTGRHPDEDTYEYCPDHWDLWQADCPRCEECSQFHYGMSVAEFRRSPNSKIVIDTMNADGTWNTQEIRIE